MRTSLIIGNSAAGAFAGLFLFLFLATPCSAGECSEGKGFFSNNVLGLCGKGDTLWTISAKEQSLAFNMIAGAENISNPTDESHWWSYSLECKNGGIGELALGGGYALASLDSAPNTIWTYNHASSEIDEFPLQWPVVDSSITFTVYDAVWASGSFYFAAQNGGVVRWNPKTGKKHVFFPGNPSVYYQPELKTSQIPKDSMRSVIGAETFKTDSVIIITTPSRLFYFSVTDSSWDSSVSVKLSETNSEFRSFERVFVNTIEPSHPLYSTINVHIKNSGTDTTWFYKYNRKKAAWDIMLSAEPKSVSFAHNGYIYMLFDEARPGSSLENIARIFRDTNGDSATVKDPDPVVSENKISRRLTKGYDIDVPEQLNDILYIPRTDSTGYLWVATSAGLFLSPAEKPGVDTSGFILIKRAPLVSAGLKTTYARPGILTPWVKNCTFIYNIKKASAKVTIKVYDYNMDLVKTIIDNRTRLSGKNGGPLGRSTVESEDQWDGNNARGRPCAPGVYYYKITTDSGEKSIGKIVISR